MVHFMEEYDKMLMPRLGNCGLDFIAGVSYALSAKITMPSSTIQLSTRYKTKRAICTKVKRIGAISSKAEYKPNKIARSRYEYNDPYDSNALSIKVENLWLKWW